MSNYRITTRRSTAPYANTGTQYLEPHCTLDEALDRARTIASYTARGDGSPDRWVELEEMTATQTERSTSYRLLWTNRVMGGA